MKKFIFSLLSVLLTVSVFAWDVPKYYLKPIKPAFSAPFVKESKKVLAGNINVIYCRYRTTPCDQVIEAFLKAEIQENYDRYFAFTIVFANGIHWQTWKTLPAMVTDYYFFISTTSCNSITDYYSGWYNPQW